MIDGGYDALTVDCDEVAAVLIDLCLGDVNGDVLVH